MNEECAVSKDRPHSGSRALDLLQFCLVLVTYSALAVPVQLHVTVPGQPAAVTTPRAIDVQVIGGPPGLQTERLIRAESGLSQIDLPEPGVWYVTACAPGFWGETAVVIAPHGEGVVELRLWPAATLRAQLPLTPAMKHVGIRFQSAISRPGDTSTVATTPPPASADCVIDGRRLECVIPAGRMDYSLRSPGYVPVYRWDRVHAPGELVNLGKVEFRKGASLIGAVTKPAHWPDGNRVRVTLAAELVSAIRPDEEAREQITTTTVLADDRGRFVFEGVKPGAYQVSARAPGLISENRTVTILDGLEAELRESLVLAPPLTLSVNVDPVMDPWLHPWIIELTQINRKARQSNVVKSSPAASDGSWTQSRLPPGDYIVKVRREPQGVWYSESLTLNDDRRVQVTVPLTKLAGVLKLGDKPLPGSIWFGGELGEVSVPVKTDAQGIFRAFLPTVENNVWKDVDVVADVPQVRTTLNDLHLQGPNEKGISTVEIVLPANRIYGEVTAEQGSAVSSNATVYVSNTSGGVSPFQVQVDEGGFFSFNGLTPGTYTVRAIGEAGKSDGIAVTIQNGSDVDVKLVLKASDRVAGLVTSLYGPVSGAKVSIYPEDRVTFGIVEWDRTDFEGRFSVAAPRQSRNLSVAVAAPGYAYELFGIPVVPDEPVAVRVEQNGGRLVGVLAARSQRQPFLFHNGAFLPIRTLENAGIAQWSGSTFTVENLAPGQYEMCVATPAEAQVFAASSRPTEQCTGGFLAPRGLLTLDEPERKKGT